MGRRWLLSVSRLRRSQEWAQNRLTTQGQPVVSTANIAQLAADLLISSLSLRAIGTFDSRDLVPVIGGREDGQQGITTPLECE
jgi:PAC2 family